MTFRRIHLPGIFLLMTVLGAFSPAQNAPRPGAATYSPNPPSTPVSPGNWSQLAEFPASGSQVVIVGDDLVTSASYFHTAAYYVLHRTGTSWNRIATLTPPGGGSIAFDGNTVVVGSSSSPAGYAYVFVKPPAGWTDMTPTATLTSTNGDNYFGDSVCVSGSTIVVADPAFFTSPGQAYVYVQPPGGWRNMTQTAELTSSDGMDLDSFGYSVSISGSTVVVGAPQGEFTTGKAYVFVQPSTGWVDMTQTAELTASDAPEDSGFGWSVSIDGPNVLVGAPAIYNLNGLPGKAYVFIRPAAGWSNMTQTAELSGANAGRGAEFGSSVAISGNLAMVGAQRRGAPPNGEAGGVYVFDKPGGGWQDATSNVLITGADAHYFGLFGNSVSTNGTLLAIGRFGFETGPAVYVFGVH